MTEQDEVQILQYASFYRIILDDNGIGGMDAKHLMEISLLRPESKMIEPDIDKRMIIADQAIQAIKNGELPSLEYNEEQEAIQKRKLDGVTVRTVKR